MLEWLFDPQAWIALVTLTALEIVLGVDNIIFISILVGVALIAEGWDYHIPKGYIYFAMAFSVAVEMLNIRMRPAAAKRSTCASTFPPVSAGRCPGDAQGN